MVTLFKGTESPTDHGKHHHKGSDSYSTYQEPDTRVPPKASPLFSEISVNGVSILEQEILAEAQNHPAKNPGEALASAARALVVRELLLQRAKALGFATDDRTAEDAPQETEDDALIRALIEREVKAPVATEEECLRFYRGNTSRFKSESIVEASHILVTAPDSEGSPVAAAERQANELIAELNRSPDRFEELARNFSSCPSAAQGGNLGQLTRGSTVEAFEAAISTMLPGEVSQSPVRSRYGFHVIRVNRRIEGQLLPFEYVRYKIAAWLEASAWSKAVSQFIAILAAEAEIKGIDLMRSDNSLLQ